MYGSEDFVDEPCQVEKFRVADDTTATYPEISATVIIRIALIILLRAGFLLVQIGNIPVTNVNLILLHNIVEMCWVTICSILIGSALAFTGDVGGVIGGGYWIGDEEIDREKVLIAWQSVIVASGIFTNCIAGRMHTVGTLVIGLIFGGLLQPVIMHWGWSSNGWMNHNRLRSGNLGFLDAGGGALIHAAGGLLGFIGCLVLGRKVDASEVDAPIGSTFAGYFFILLGLQSLRISSSSDGNVGSRDSDVHATMINILLSISACAMVTVALHFFRREAFNQTTVTRCVQGMIAGDVVVAAGANIYPPYVSLVLGASNGILFYFMVRIIEQSAVEDYCNTMAIHLIPGLFGALVVPFFKKSDDGFDAINTLLDFSWQIICLLSIMGIIILIMTSVFMALGCCRVLRNRSEHLSHLRASAALVGQPTRSFMPRLVHHDVQALRQPGTVPSRESETVTDSRIVKHETSLARLEMPDQGIIDPRIQDNTAVMAQPESRVRKLRSIHTIRSTDDFESNTSMSRATNHELHRTFSTMDLSKERTIECTDVEVLVEPRFKSLENSESEDDNVFSQKPSARLKCDIDIGDSGDQALEDKLRDYVM